MSAPSAEAGKALFTKPCGGAAPTEAQWPELNSEDVPFTDPTQEKQGFKAHLSAQQELINRCAEVILKPADHAISGDVAFIECTMGPKSGLWNLSIQVPAVCASTATG